MKRLAFAAISTAAAIASCTTTTRPIGELGEVIAPPSLAPSGEAEAGASVGLCASNECPAGRVTCPNNPFPCAVDLTSDDDNCGSCGVRCPTDEAFTGRFNGAMHCIGGVCRLSCFSTYADCNNSLDDGCETLVTGEGAHDVDNCGGCGIVCSQICNYGNCGCSAGQTYCEYDQKCHVLHRDNGNCGECGNVCPPDTEPPIPARLRANRTCRGGECNKLGCISGYGDCNNDLVLRPEGDGCETSTRSDPNNCGDCGNVCAPGEICAFGECRCPCGAICFKAINTDPYNCGTCGFQCPGDWSSLGSSPRQSLDPAHGRPVCEQGMCGYTCSANWGDCDDDIENGCETDLLEDPLNCGGCGIRCDGIEGQACVDGRCLMRDCEVQ